MSFGKAIGNYLIRTVASTDQVVQDANRRILEGKLADALFHAALDPLTNTEENVFKATQESGWIRSAGAIAAAAYGGAGGAAAYASWQTYRATDGNAELALRAGMIAGLSSMATEGINDIQKVESFDVVKKAVLAGAVGGLTIAASGGSESEVLEGFILAGGMVIIQDGYKEAIGHKLDPRGATGDPYCATAGAEGCKAFEQAYYIDENGRPRIDYSKLDPNASYVGEGHMPGQTRPAYSWTQDRSPFMQNVGKLPGFNAMALFHDNWVLSWQMSDWANKATIFPAVVMTYYGTGEALTKRITDLHIQAADPSAQAPVTVNRNDLTMEPSLVLAQKIRDEGIPDEFDPDPANTKKIMDYHVAQTNLVPKGKYAIVRNISNGKMQRVVVIGGLPAREQATNTQILLSPLTLSALGIVNTTSIVQVEPEELILVSTLTPPDSELVPDMEMAYIRKGDTLNFPDFDVDENTRWNLTVMGPGGAQSVENFSKRWKAELRRGQYMYTLLNDAEGQLPWGYYGFFKVIDDAPEAPGLWSTSGSDQAGNEETYLIVNGRRIAAEGEISGTTATMSAEDGSLAILLTDVPNGSSTVNADKFSGNCSTCLGIMITDINEARNFVAVSGNFTRSGNVLVFDVRIKEMDDFASGAARTYQVKGRFRQEE